MANNYMLSSSLINIGDATRAQVLEAMSMIEHAVEVFGSGGDEFDVKDIDKFFDGIDSYIKDKRSIKIAAKIMKTVHGWKLDCEYLGFCWQIDENDTDIWVHADESIDVDSAVRCLQLLATVVPEMQSAAPWYMTWACTCSKMRVDEFNGGAVVFTHRRAKFMNASSWASATVEKFKKQTGKKKK